MGMTRDQLRRAKAFLEVDPVHFSLKTLGIRQLDLDRISRINEVGGVKEWAMKLLKVTTESLVEFHTWASMNKVAKIESLIPKMSSPRDYLNLVYTHYLCHKEKHKASWKQQTAKQHLLRIKQIADECIVTDSMTLNQAREIAMRSYFAIWTALAAAPPEVAKIVPLTLYEKAA